MKVIGLKKKINQNKKSNLLFFLYSFVGLGKKGAEYFMLFDRGSFLCLDLYPLSLSNDPIFKVLGKHLSN